MNDRQRLISLKNLSLFILITSLFFLCIAGVHNLQKIKNQNDLFTAWQQDTTRYHQQKTIETQMLRNLKPGQGLIKANEGQLPDAMGDPYLSASQGVEVHMEGIRWQGKWFNAMHKHGIDQMGGIAEIQINQAVFDPDYEQAGKPDLNIEVTPPRFFKMKNFLNDWLSGYQLGGFLEKSFGEKKPVETYDLETLPGKRQKMSHWLMEFDVFFRIEPSPVHNNNNIGNLDRHPVTGILTRRIRRNRESKNQRFGFVSVMLKFKPKNGTWYIADEDHTGMLIPNGEPKIGIGAVECIGIKQVSESEKIQNIGVYLRRGSGLALYNTPEEIDNKFKHGKININDVQRPVENNIFSKGAIANPNLFGKEKYAIIHLTNMGSWQEGSWLSGIDRYADQYHARFVIHTYVLGEWDIKPLNIAEPAPRPPFSIKKAGILDFLLPDLNLGWLGKIFSGTGWVIFCIILLCLFFPPLRILVNKLLGSIVTAITTLLQKKQKNA